MNKIEFIKSLKRVKLVIGNGFDLHCGLHTTYGDYFCRNRKSLEFIRDLYTSFKRAGTICFNFSERRFSDMNIWDVFFVVNGPGNLAECCKRWCDIENMMLNSFSNKNNTASDVEELVIRLTSTTNWRDIYYFVTRDIEAKEWEDRFITMFAKEKMWHLKIYPGDFYTFLLDELKEFEKRFGEFIYYQLHDYYFERINYNSQQFLNVPYIRKATDTIDLLCNVDNLVGIDSFNYSYIHQEKLMELLQHINGSFKNPIFGIDTIFEPNDECFIFTKTARRIDSDMLEESFESKPDFDNLIVYGHSLNKADYSYFFPIFDKLLLTDSLSTKTIVFAYSIFDKDKKEELKAYTRKAVSDIMFAYAKSKQLPDPGRFLDSLSTQKRIIMYEVPPLDSMNYGSCHIDEEWDAIYKENNLLNESEKTK